MSTTFLRKSIFFFLFLFLFFPQLQLHFEKNTLNSRVALNLPGIAKVQKNQTPHVGNNLGMVAPHPRDDQGIPRWMNVQGGQSCVVPKTGHNKASVLASNMYQEHEVCGGGRAKRVPEEDS